jgi:Flp pilus assembly protein TadG
MVTAETAAVLPVLALVTAVAFWGISAVASQVRCGDAAREAARAAARGESAAQIQLAATRAAPAGARFRVAHGAAGWLTVTVTARVGPLGHWLPSITVTGNAVAAAETTGAG